MKKIVRKGIVILSVYLIAVVCTFLVSDRVQELESNNNYKNTNKSLTVNLSR